MSASSNPERSRSAVRVLRDKLWSVSPTLPRLSLEVAVLCASALAGIWVLGKPQYTQWHSTVVAWVLVLPIMTGLVHGLAAAILLTVVAAAGVHVEMPGRWGTLTDPFIASGVVAALAGHLSDMRRSALAIAHEKLAVQSQQLERQFRQHQVLRTSHALLTERTSAQEWSLSGGVDAALRLVSEGPVARSADALLALLESQAMVRVAAVYVEESPRKLSPRPVATLGVHGPVFSHHLAVRSAFQLGELVVPRADLQGHEGATAAVVVAVPLMTTTGRVYGVVAIYELPFVATHDAHFRLIATLASSVADALLEQVEAAPRSTLAATVAARAQPVLAEPMLAQPVLAEPMLAQPVLAEPMLAQPMLAEPMLAEPVLGPARKTTLHGLAQRVVAPAPAVAPAEAPPESHTVVARPVIAVRPRPTAPSISHTLEGRLPLPGAFQMPAETVPVRGLFSGHTPRPSRPGDPVEAPLPMAAPPSREERGSAPRPIPASRRRGLDTGAGIREATSRSPVQHASGA